MALSYEIRNFFLLNSHDRISMSATKYTEKPKTFQLLYFTRTRKLNGVFPILSIKVLHLLPKISMFCALSQTNQQLFEK